MCGYSCGNRLADLKQLASVSKETIFQTSVVLIAQVLLRGFSRFLFKTTMGISQRSSVIDWFVAFFSKQIWAYWRVIVWLLSLPFQNSCGHLATPKCFSDWLTSPSFQNKLALVSGSNVAASLELEPPVFYHRWRNSFLAWDGPGHL